MLVSSPPFHGGEPGAAPGSPTKKYGLLVQLEKHLFCRQESGGRIPYGPLWVSSSVGRTLHQHWRGHGSESRLYPLLAALAKMVYAWDWKSWDSRSLREGGTNKLSIGITTGSVCHSDKVETDGSNPSLWTIWHCRIVVYSTGLSNRIYNRGSESHQCR